MLSADGGEERRGCEDNRLDELLKNLAKESLNLQADEVNAKDKSSRVESTVSSSSSSHCSSKLNTTTRINIPNNQSLKSTNHAGLAKPLAPDQLKCNILKGKHPFHSFKMDSFLEFTILPILSFNSFFKCWLIRLESSINIKITNPICFYLELFIILKTF